MFMLHFICCNIILSIYFMLYLVLKTAYGSKIPSLCRYISCIMFIVCALFVFVPQIIPLHYSIPTSAVHTDTLYTNTANTALNSDFKDLYLSVNKYGTLFTAIWTSGIAIKLSLLLIGRIMLAKKARTFKSCINPVFDNCRRELGVKAELYVSDNIASPFSFGIIKKYVAVPSYVLEYPTENMRCIFYHELIHHKHKDILLNVMLGIVGCIYWFNPIIQYAEKNIRLDLEIYCDRCCISLLNNTKTYADTIIAFASDRKTLPLISSISGSKRGVKARIMQLALHKKPVSRAAAVIAMVLPLVSVCCINAFGYTSDNYSGQIHNAEYVDLSSFFTGFDGCFVAYSAANDKYIIYNEQLCRKRVSPNSTYKTAIALNALENGIITEENNLYPATATNYPFVEWNRAQTLDSAMKYSVNWYFQQLDTQLDNSQINAFLKKTSYGNQSAGIDRDNYWLENTLKISPLEQVHFLKGLYFNEFGFKEKNIQTVLNSMRVNDSLYAKTGTGQINGKTQNGCYIGIYKNKNDTVIFALRLSADNGADGKTAEKIAEKILYN